MNCKINGSVKRNIREGFPKFSGDGYNDILRKLHLYFHDRQNDIAKLSVQNNKASDNKIDDLTFFSELLKYSEVLLEDADVNEFIREFMKNDYYLTEIKTEKPQIKYNLGLKFGPEECKTVWSLLKATVAVNINFALDNNEVYSISDLLKLQNEGKILVLNNRESHQNITPEEYLKYQSRDSKLLLPFDFDEVTLANIKTIFSFYPELLTLLREKVNYEVVDKLVDEYNDFLLETMTNELELTEEKAMEYQNVLRAVKTFVKKKD